MRRGLNNFLAVNAAFILVFVGLAIFQPPVWGWLVFIGAWCLADYILAKDIHLAWWHWVVLVLILVIVDVIVLRLTGQI